MSKKQILTFSRMKTFRGCPRKEWYRYEAGLRPAGPEAAPLMFGTLWHDCLAEFYEAMKASQALCESGEGSSYTYDSNFAKSVLMGAGNAVEHERKKLGLPQINVIESWLFEKYNEKSDIVVDGGEYGTHFYSMSDEKKEKIDGMAAMARSMFSRYIDTYWNLDYSNWEIVCIEKTMITPLRTQNNTASSKWDFSGVPDLIVKLRATGKYYVVEHKSTVDVEKMLDQCRFDQQGVGYCWLISEVGMCEPSDIGGVVYRATRKKIPSDPKIVKSGAVSASACDTTPSKYLKALELAETDGHERTAKHSAILKALKARHPQKWLDQIIVPVDERALDSWRDGTYITSVAKNAAQSYGEVGHWKVGSTAGCFSYNRMCPYLPLCEQNEPALDILRDDFMLRELYEIKAAHEELQLPG